MTLFYLLDQKKNPYPVSQYEWSEWLERSYLDGSRTIKYTDLHKYSIQISTVFLGIDHNWDILGHRDPVLFETMIFFNSDYFDLPYYKQRYTSYKDAIQGHRDTVRMIINKIRDEGVIL